eukprot:scaffold2206_cov157-Isochrysis_galbana.AAC.1
MPRPRASSCTASDAMNGFRRFAMCTGVPTGSAEAKYGAVNISTKPTTLSSDAPMLLAVQTKSAVCPCLCESPTTCSRRTRTCCIGLSSREKTSTRSPETVHISALASERMLALRAASLAQTWHRDARNHRPFTALSLEVCNPPMHSHGIRIGVSAADDLMPMHSHGTMRSSVSAAAFTLRTLLRADMPFAAIRAPILAPTTTGLVGTWGRPPLPLSGGVRACP